MPVYLQSIQLMVRQRRLSLFGHVARMGDNVPAKAVLRVAGDVRDGVPPFPNWRRLWGRPPITWLHQICSDCGLSVGDALNCSQYRVASGRVENVRNGLLGLALTMKTTVYRAPISQYVKLLLLHVSAQHQSSAHGTPTSVDVGL